MAKSYAGYVKRPTPINWSTVAGDIINKMGDVEEEQAAFREKYDTIANELYTKIGDYEAGKSQDFNNFVYNGIASGRDMLAEMHNKLKRREISPDDFNRMSMSMGTQMDEFKKLTTNYNESIEETIEGIDSGKLDSELSGWALTKFGQLADLKNKNLQWMPGKDGYSSLYVTKLDDGGNVVGDPTSINSAVNPANLVFNKVNAPEEIKKYTADIAKYQVGRVMDASMREGYNDFKKSAIAEILNNDNAIASVLTQYANYKAYGEGDYENSWDEPDKGIKMISVNDSFNPEITEYPDMKKEAEDILGNMFDQQIDYVKTFKEYTDSGDDKEAWKKEQKRLNKLQTGYNITMNASRGDFSGMNKTNFSFKKTDKGIEVRRKTDTKTIPIHTGDDALEIGTRETAKILSQYTKEFSSTGQQSEWSEIDVLLGDYAGKDLKMEAVSTQVEGEAFEPSVDDIKLQSMIWSGEGADHAGVTDSDTEEGINTVKPSIIAYIQKNAPNAKVTFGETTMGISEGWTTTKHKTPLYVDGEYIDDIWFDVSDDKFLEKDFNKVMKKAINKGRMQTKYGFKPVETETETTTETEEVDYSEK